ncbi:hypothetical protein BH09BAC5_BH09BAC5_22050 [soil metagenome]
MTAKELKRIFSKGECLSLDAMRLYNDGKLNKKSMHEVEKHLLECNLCSGAVDGLNTRRIAEVNKLSDHIQRRLAVYMNTPPKISFFRRFGILIITGFLVFCIGGTWLYFARNHQKNVPVIIADTSDTYQQKQNDAAVEVNEVATQPNADVFFKDNTSTDSKEKDINTNQVQSTQQTSGEPISNQVNQPTNTPEIIPQQTTGNEKNNSDPQTNSGPTTRSDNSLIHIKSVQIYPAVTHNDKTTRKEAKDGQLGKPSGNSGAAFGLDEMPTFPGGNEALKNYIISNFKPTASDRSKLTRFATGVRFVVNSKTGKISAPEISFTISPEIDKELLRVINSIPEFSPGKKHGEIDMMIGITFE